MRQVIRRFAVLGTSSLLTQLISFVALAIVARRVGPANLGAYTIALSIVTFLSLPMSSGMTAVGTRDVARDRSRVREVMGEVLVLQLLLAVPGYALVVAVAPLISPTAAMASVMPIVGLFLFTGTSFEWALQALGEMRAIAVARVVGQVTYGALVPVFVVSGSEGIKRYAWLMIGGLAVKHVLTVWFVVRRAGVPKFRIETSALRERLRGSLAMGYVSVMLSIYGTIDQIMLGYFSNAYDVGEYAAASKIPGAVGSFADSWTAVVFPHSANLGATDRRRLPRELGRLISVVAFLTIPLAACTPFVAHDLLVVAFGAQYGAASTAFALLTIALAIGLIDGTIVTAMIGLGRDRFFARAVTATVVINIALNLVGIPLFGREGAAANTIISEVIGLGVMLHGAAAIGGVRPEWDRLGRIVLATCPAVLALVLVPGSVSVWLRIAMAVAIYLAAAVALGAVRVGELHKVLGRDHSGRPLSEGPSPVAG